MQGNKRDLERKLAGQLMVDKELPELYLVRLHLVMGAYILSLCDASSWEHVPNTWSKNEAAGPSARLNEDSAQNLILQP